MNEEAKAILEKIKGESDYFEKAKALLHLQKDYKISIKDMSSSLGLTASYVCHILRLNKLPPLIVDGYYAQSVSLSHLFVISRLKNVQSMTHLYERVLGESLTVAQTEVLVRENLYNVKDDGQRLSKEETEELVARFELPNVKVKVTQTRVKSKVLLEVSGNLRETTATLRKISRLFTQN